MFVFNRLKYYYRCYMSKYEFADTRFIGNKFYGYDNSKNYLFIAFVYLNNKIRKMPVLITIYEDNRVQISMCPYLTIMATKQNNKLTNIWFGYNYNNIVRGLDENNITYFVYHKILDYENYSSSVHKRIENNIIKTIDILTRINNKSHYYDITLHYENGVLNDIECLLIDYNTSRFISNYYVKNTDIQI